MIPPQTQQQKDCGVVVVVCKPNLETTRLCVDQLHSQYVNDLLFWLQK